jgi:hypothetical protein
LSGGEIISANWVVCSADGHATIYNMLGAKYADARTAKLCRTMEHGGVADRKIL